MSDDLRGLAELEAQDTGVEERVCYICRHRVHWRQAALVRHGERLDYVCTRCRGVHRHGGHDANT